VAFLVAVGRRGLAATLPIEVVSGRTPTRIRQPGGRWPRARAPTSTGSLLRARAPTSTAPDLAGGPPAVLLLPLCSGLGPGPLRRLPPLPALQR
jgi:hypothetical protein